MKTSRPGELINIALEKIEDANRAKLEGVFRNIDFNSEANLGRPKDRNRRLKNLIEDFAKPALDLRPSRVSPDGEFDRALRGGKSLPGGALVLENIDVVNGEVQVLGEQNGREYRLEGLNMHMSARSMAGPWHIDGTMRADGIDTAFSLRTGALLPGGGVRLRARLLPVSHLDEFVFRFDRRKTRHAAFKSLLGIAVEKPPVTYNMLIKPEGTG